MNRIKTAVFVSGGGTNLQALIDAAGNGTVKSAELSLVISDNPDAYALQRAERAGIKTEVVLKKNYSVRAEFEKEILAKLEENKTELIVLAGFMCILSEEFTRKYERRIINVHPSLIPAFCGEGFFGLRVHKAALGRGVKITGATVHYVNEIADGGEIIMQKAVSVEPGDTPEILQKRVMTQAEWIILPQALEKVAAELLAKKTAEIEVIE